MYKSDDVYNSKRECKIEIQLPFNPLRTKLFHECGQRFTLGIMLD